MVVGVRLESSQIMTMQRSFSGGHLQMPIQPTIEEGEQGGVKDSKVVHFWIRDTGIGIPRDKYAQRERGREREREREGGRE